MGFLVDFKTTILLETVPYILIVYIQLITRQGLLFYAILIILRHSTQINKSIST